MQLLVGVPEWVRDRAVLYLLDTICHQAFTHPPLWHLVLSTFSEFIKVRLLYLQGWSSINPVLVEYTPSISEYRQTVIGHQWQCYNNPLLRVFLICTIMLYLAVLESGVCLMSERLGCLCCFRAGSVRRPSVTMVVVVVMYLLVKLKSLKDVCAIPELGM